MRQMTLLWLLLIPLLASCSSGPTVDLTLPLRPGDTLAYQRDHTITGRVEGESIGLDPIVGTIGVRFRVNSTNGAVADVDCVVELSKSAVWQLPLTVDTLTGAATIKPDAHPGRSDDQLSIFFDHYALTLGARPGNPVRVGAKWKGELRQLPFGVYVKDPMRIPVQYQLVRVERSMAVISLSGVKKLSVEEFGKEPGVATGTLTISGTMFVDLSTRLVEAADVQAITKLHHSGSGKNTEGIYTIALKRVS